MTHETLAYGLWPSPITPLSLSRGLRLSDVAWDSDGQTLLWLEGRSDRGVLVAAGMGGDAPRDLTDDLSVRARLGYGGGDMTAGHGYAYFVANSRLYRRPLAPGQAQPVTPALGDLAAPAVSPDGQWLVYVYSHEHADGLAIVDTAGALWPQKLTQGHDFYMQPAWHPDGQYLAWISWDHPQMPWDGTALTLASLRLDGELPRIAGKRVLAGSPDQAIAQPQFSPDGRFLSYLSDETGWDNLYLYDLRTEQYVPLVTGPVDLGAPAWVQGVRTYAWGADSGTIYYTRNEGGFARLWSVHVVTGEMAPVAALGEYTEVTQPAVSPQGALAVLASSPSVPRRVLVYDPVGGEVRVMARSASESVPPQIISRPQAVSWTASNGDEVHGLFYAPANDCYVSPGRPPLIVRVHGGPTSQALARHDPQVQFFATRGYAVLEVNYRGSAGYGRAYRNRLREQWGVYDVEDAVGGARYVAGQGWVDPERMVIMGGSAGGYTVLQALSHYPGTFKAGLCLYGVTNLFTLASDTHKFEERYLDSMVGPLPGAAQRYRERSPIFYTERIVDPVAIFQGEEDRVVPKDQAETIVAALRRRGVPHEYHLYAGEGHGWRRAETIQSFHEAVLRFLKQYVLFA